MSVVQRIDTERLPKRVETLIAILHTWQEAHRRWPSVREMSRALNLKSESGALYWLYDGIRRGVVRAADDGGSRQYRPNYANLVIQRSGGIMTIWKRLDVWEAA